MARVVKSPHAKGGDIRDEGSVPGSRRFRHSNPLQYFFPENPLDRGAWWATVHRVTKSRTRLKQLNTHSYIFYQGNKELKKKLTSAEKISLKSTRRKISLYVGTIDTNRNQQFFVFETKNIYNINIQYDVNQSSGFFKIHF